MQGKPKRKVADFNSNSISLNKYISDTGFCSRREADNYIDQARVTINDNVAIPGNRVSSGDLIEIDGEPIGKKKATVYIAYHKPAGITSTTDTSDKTNIIDAIGHQQRIFPVGRLDKESEGLIFLTNDGNIVNKILRSGNEHEKEYIVSVDKPISKEFTDAMAVGVRIPDGLTLPCKVVQEGKSTFRITLVQGLNRQIRRMCTALGFEVKRLKRVRIMNVHIAGLAVGHWRYLTPEETTGILRMVSDSIQGTKAGKPKAVPQASPKKAPAPKKQEITRLAKEKPEQKSTIGKKSSYKDYRKRSR